MTDLHLQGKVIVVTGGGLGIGADMTRFFLRKAWPVIFARRSPDPDWLRRTSADFVQAELADDDTCGSAIETVRSRHGTVYGLVNNAGANDGVRMTGARLPFARA